MLTENQKIIDIFGQEEEITFFKYYKNIMLDDNILYSIYAENKIYPTLIAKNISKGSIQKYVMSHLEKEEKIVFLDLVNDYKNICVVSELQDNYRLSLIDANSKNVYCSESIYFKFKGAIVPFSNDKILFLYNDTEIYLTQIGQEIKPISLKINKILEEGENIVEAISAMQNELTIYLITDKGNMYYLSISMAQSEVSKFEKQFLGNFETIDDEGNLVTKNRLPSSICCN